MATSPQQAYREGEILQADPVHLVEMLYRGALEAVAQARLALRKKDIPGRGRHVLKAKEILNELALGVDRDRGGEIARNLVELYAYMQTLLQDANFRQVDEPLAETERLLRTLLEAWEQIRRLSSEAPPVSMPVCGYGEDAGYAPRCYTY